MEFMTELWLPIILCGIALFFASFVSWTMMPHRKAEWKQLPDEGGFLDSTRSLNIPPGRYSFPHGTDPAVRNSEEFKQAWEKGPKGTMIVWGEVNMGMNMLGTIAFFLVASVFIAYISWFAMQGKEVTFLSVFRLTGTTGFLAYTMAGIPNSIWFKRSVPNDIIDGIVYALITGVLFALLWPQT